VDFGWQFADPTQDEAATPLFSTLSSDQDNLFWWHQDDGLLIAWNDHDSDDPEPRIRIGVLACELEDLSVLLMDVRRLAAEQNKTSVFWLAPVHAQVEAALQSAGYSSDWENTAYVFEKRHPSIL
jgi:hypothetical protein